MRKPIPRVKIQGSEYRLMYRMEMLHQQHELAQGKPLILFIDEMDKVPEIDHRGAERTQPVIKTVNQMLSDGKIIDSSFAGGELDFSNVFVITALNFAPKQIEAFSKEVLGKELSFWDYKEPDMEKLDGWLVSKEGTNKSSVAKMLALLFRPNTISRMISDAIVAKPLYGKIL